MDSLSDAKTGMAIRDGVVVATVKLPPVGDTIVVMAHGLQHVIELTRGLDLKAEAGRRGSGVWKTLGGHETQAAVDRLDYNTVRPHASLGQQTPAAYAAAAGSGSKLGFR